MYGCYGDLQIMCEGLWSLRHRGLVYQVTQAIKTTYPNIGKWIIPDEGGGDTGREGGSELGREAGTGSSSVRFISTSGL